jgi:L-amino acid N-acyltransferase YncA
MELRFAAGDDDVAGIHEIYAPIVEHTAISFETSVPPHEELTRRLAETVPQYPWLVATEDDKILGYAYGHQFSARAAYAWSVETSIYVRESARAGGVGRALYSALLRLLTVQGYQQAFAGITLPNAASVGLHEAMGFRRIGTYHDVGFKFGAWHDVGWWQRALGNDPNPPPAPISLDDVDPALVEHTLRPR